jgi:peptide deformylase
MVLSVVKYGAPVLRKKGERIGAITPSIQQLIVDMFDTMYAYKGIGLAAQQVGFALQLTVLDVRGVTDRPSTVERHGKEVDVEKFMPLVLINPEITLLGNPVSGPEGCLSFPEIYADISRPEIVEVKAVDSGLRPLEFHCGGLLARAIQHETDHLNGLLFIDRMSKSVKADLRDELEELQARTKAELSAKR